MNQADARNFAMALNNIGQYVPPMFFQPLLCGVAAQLIQDVANGEVTIEIKPVPKTGAAGLAKPQLVADNEGGGGG